MFTVQGSIVLRKDDITEKSRNELFNYFNTKELPIDFALSADVRILPAKEKERVLFAHPFNLFDEIKGKMDNGTADSACISFSKKTGVMRVCMGNYHQVQLYIANSETTIDER
jgi:hypothetical protein